MTAEAYPRRVSAVSTVPETITGAEPTTSTADREDQLARVSFFDGLTREALALIAQVTAEETHALGTRIFQYGDIGDKLFIILEGRVRISREVAGIGEEALAILGPGEIFGEM